MAIDAWLLDRHLQGHPPILRFYTWKPTAISLGFHQRHIPEQWAEISWQGEAVDLVRRPTGGRAVLHQGDLTYALVTSNLKGDRLQVYQTLCEFLIQGWRSLGVELRYGQAGRGYIHNPNCFGTATGADLLMTDGAKLIGSAQLYRSAAVLQHGSMPLNLSSALFEQVFGVRPTLPTLSASLKDSQVVMAALIRSAHHCFQANFEIQPLSEAEWQHIRDCSTSMLFPLHPLKAQTRDSRSHQQDSNDLPEVQGSLDD